LNNRSTLLYAVSSHGPSRFEQVSKAELEIILLEDQLKRKSEPETLLVDARFSADFARGTIPRAVNIPVDSSLNDIRSYFSNIDRETKIVVFCLSNRCAFDRQVAVKIAGEGFENVMIFEEGWYGWDDRSAR
jgi:rhodanese-related sulfurtransferase